jgi:hypothetical protein
MPGHPARTRARFRMSPGNSPSRIAGFATGSPQSSFDMLRESHVFGAFTVRQNAARRNGKTPRACAEAVED